MSELFGKYRGTVVNNIDPLMMGRLQVQVSAVHADGQWSWAMPCVPFAGTQAGMFVRPAVGSGVWVEFEQGDSDYPIWAGCWWGAGEMPAMAEGLGPVPGVVIQTPAQHAFAISDMPGPAGGLLLKSSNGATISVSDAGIFITNGAGATIELVGSVVTVNGNPLP